MAQSVLKVDKRQEQWKTRLLDPKFALVGEIYQQRQPDGYEELANLLYNFFKAHGKEKNLVRWVIIEEVKTSSGAGTLFREESVLMKLLSRLWIQTGATAFLRATVMTLVDNMKEVTKDRSLEIDPRKVTETAVIEANCTTMVEMAESFVSVLLANVDTMPREMRVIFKELCEEVAGRYPKLRDTIVPSILFLRFICPSIIAPQNFGLPPAEPTGDLARGLVLISKVFTNLSNGVSMDMTNDRPGVAILNKFIEEKTDVIIKFAKDLIDVESDAKWLKKQEKRRKKERQNRKEKLQKTKGRSSMIELKKKNSYDDVKQAAANSIKRKSSDSGVLVKDKVVRDSKKKNKKRKKLRKQQQELLAKKLETLASEEKDKQEEQQTAQLEAHHNGDTSQPTSNGHASKEEKHEEPSETSVDSTPEPPVQAQPELSPEEQQHIALNALLDYLAKRVETDNALSLLPNDLALSVHNCSDQIKRMNVAVEHKDWKLAKKKSKDVQTFHKRILGKDIVFVKSVAVVGAEMRALHNFLSQVVANPSEKDMGPDNVPASDSEEPLRDEQDDDNTENTMTPRGKSTLDTIPEEEEFGTTTTTHNHNIHNSLNNNHDHSKDEKTSTEEETHTTTSTVSTETSEEDSSSRSDPAPIATPTPSPRTPPLRKMKEREKEKKAKTSKKKDKEVRKFPFEVTKLEDLDAYRGDYALSWTGQTSLASSSKDRETASVDFCCTRYSFMAQEERKAYCCFFSTYRKDYPKKDDIIRGEMHPSGFILEQVVNGNFIEEGKCKLTLLLQVDMKTEIDSMIFVKECTGVVDGILKFFKQRTSSNNSNSNKKARARAGSLGRSLKMELLKMSPKNIRRGELNRDKVERKGLKGSPSASRHLNFDGSDSEGAEAKDRGHKSANSKKGSISKSWGEGEEVPIVVERRGSRSFSVSEDERPLMAELTNISRAPTDNKIKLTKVGRVRSFTDYQASKSKDGEKGAKQSPRNALRHSQKEMISSQSEDEDSDESDVSSSSEESESD